MSRSAKSLRFYPISKLTSYPALVAGRDMTLLDQKQRTVCYTNSSTVVHSTVGMHSDKCVVR